MQLTDSGLGTIRGSTAQDQKVMDNVTGGWMDYSWPTLAFIAILAGAMLASVTSLPSGLDWRRLFGGRHVAEPAAHVLIVTANPDRRLQVAATLSPRGMHPLLAESLADVNAQIATHPDTLRLAVLDEAAVNSRKIGQALARSLPDNRIVLLPRSTARTAIPQLLLDRL